MARSIRWRSFTTNAQLVKSVAQLWIGTVLGAGSQFLAQWIVARKLGPSAFGSFGSAVALVTILAPLAGFGAYRFLLKAISEEGTAAVRWAPGILRFLLSSVAAILILVLLLSSVQASGSLEGGLLVILLPLILGQVVFDLVGTTYQLEERYLVLSAWQGFPAFARLGATLVGLGLYSSGFGPRSAAAAYACAAVLVFFTGLPSLRRLLAGELKIMGGKDELKERESPRAPSVLSVLKECVPFGVEGLFFLVYLQSGIVVLKYISGALQAGLYNVALMIVMAIYILPGVVYQKFLLGKLHRWAATDRAKLARAHQIGKICMCAIGFAAMAAVELLGPSVITRLLGQQYAPACAVLRILALCIPIRFLSSCDGAICSTSGLITKKVFVLAAAALANVVSGILLGERFGAAGVAIGAIISESLVLVGLSLITRSSGLTKLEYAENV